VNRWLDDKVANNWTSDEYVWSKEVVVVTGGSDGIGGIVVRLLAERGIKVVVLDVQGLTYEGKLFHVVYPFS
jgi:NADPH:quinone reductase-like Zn-dependent oxidoreductase